MEATAEIARSERPEKKSAEARIKQLLGDLRARDARIDALEKENRDLQSKIRQQASTEERKRNQAQSAFNEGLERARVKHKDFDEAFKAAASLPAEVLDALVSLGELGAEASYHLARNPQLCRALCTLLPQVAVQRVMRFAFDVERAGEIQAQCDAAAQWYQNAAAGTRKGN